uniref:30S ribosomal protein THX n=1 Tax=Thermus islandicus TaxID=540988 RepID=A0A7C2C062_9DEIN
MGKGDLRTRRGKIYRGTYGKSRPKPGKKKAAPKANAPRTPPRATVPGASSPVRSRAPSRAS